MADKRKIENIKNSKPFGVSDIIIFSVVIIVAIVLVVLMYSNKSETVEINDNGVKTTYKLNEDREIDVRGKLVVVVKDGECYVKNATCPDKVCERMGRIKNTSQTIVCAPNNIVIKISGKKDLTHITG